MRTVIFFTMLLCVNAMALPTANELFDAWAANYNEPNNFKIAFTDNIQVQDPNSGIWENRYRDDFSQGVDRGIICGERNNEKWKVSRLEQINAPIYGIVFLDSLGEKKKREFTDLNLMRKIARTINVYDGNKLYVWDVNEGIARLRENRYLPAVRVDEDGNVIETIESTMSIHLGSICTGEGAVSGFAGKRIHNYRSGKYYLEKRPNVTVKREVKEKTEFVSGIECYVVTVKTQYLNKNEKDHLTTFWFAKENDHILMQGEVKSLKNNYVYFKEKVNSIQINAQGLTVPKEIVLRTFLWKEELSNVRRLTKIDYLEYGTVPDDIEYFQIDPSKNLPVYENGRIKWQE